ncbi:MULTISPECIES: YejG family protein [Tenebrionibacter/Tenebrionicola group]|uniref:Uncharacterized protein n=2 Tax=Tenebrionibacter/Tenebrionicola group TaxID=2969848 RepID=A0A8K0XY37_9ENTR|nr:MULTISPECIES: hypothetical protein [Tenebrionibacter/Tenebrionicola group]MBK4714139.1 hypothetical protein [Tenebrionibacter intestinalis]MBV4411965.1 hypothetical protein [Tenebrionicola larvae]MBV5094825.1 hypothetical protein [Tenebrionicola larvae]
MNTLPLSVVHRLPQGYRRTAKQSGFHVEPIPPGVRCEENCLVGLKLLSPAGEGAWTIIRRLSQALSDIDVESAVLECDGGPCLFVCCRDECTATCHLKNFGVAIAETFSLTRPF